MCRAIAEKSDVIFSIVGYPADVREVIGLKPVWWLPAGVIPVDTTT